MTTFFNSQTPNQSTDSTDFSRFDWLPRARISQSPKQSTGATDFSRFDCFPRIFKFCVFIMRLVGARRVRLVFDCFMTVFLLLD